MTELHTYSRDRLDGNWMETFTGKRFYVTDPLPEEIDILDIAHSLSMQCRYAGHCQKFYSVAEHSVLLARYVSPENAMWALLHDASEAYLVDIPRPVKPALENYKALEAGIMQAVCEHFGLKGDMPMEVKDADNRIIADEREQNMSPAGKHVWVGYDKPLGVKLQLWAPEEAELQFLEAFDRLYYGIGLQPSRLAAS